MADIATAAEAAYRAVRSVLPRVNVRHSGNEYWGTAAQMMNEGSDDTLRGSRDQASGAVRLLVSELIQPHPKQQDTVSIQTTAGGEWATRIIAAPIRTERNNCIIIEYGAKHG
jgi:hypothetical protein